MGGVSGAFDFFLDFAAGAKAGVKKSSTLQLGGSLSVVVEMLALDPDGFFPFDAKPGKVFENLAGILFVTARVVDVFDPK